MSNGYTPSEQTSMNMIDREAIRLNWSQETTSTVKYDKCLFIRLATDVHPSLTSISYGNKNDHFRTTISYIMSIHFPGTPRTNSSVRRSSILVHYLNDRNGSLRQLTIGKHILFFIHLVNCCTLCHLHLSYNYRQLTSASYLSDSS